MHDSLQGQRRGWRKLRERGWIFVQNRGHGLSGGGLAKGPRAGEHFVEDGAKGEHIGAMVRWLPTHLLGRHVTSGTHHAAWIGSVVLSEGAIVCRDVAGLGQLGQAEVEDLHSSIPNEEKVLRLQVTMNNSLLVRGG